MKNSDSISKKALILLASIGILFSGLIVLWIGTIQIPDFKSLQDRVVQSSTKIYDRTGQVLLYDVHNNIKRTVIPSEDMGVYIKNATVAIEDANFYQHGGIRITSIIRAILVNLFNGQFSQGGSTITQQIVKNTILTSEKTITRKLKEWVLSVKVDQTLSKDEILSIYLNEAPYGGNVYGIEEAARSFFGKEPKDLTLAEASYLAAIPNAPTFYSPYGKNLDKLEQRKNLVLSRMKSLGFISDQDYQNAANEKVSFLPQEPFGIKAPHFVFFVKEYLEEKYGKDAVESGGLKVTTTLDYNLEKQAEDIVLKYAKDNEVKFNGKNAALVAIDPKTGQILTMVGSRDYFDKEIDGNFNIALAHRQPGSSFKPFVYATAFNKGYTPDTVVFDVPTEFQSTCDPYGKALPGQNQADCYMPENYDGKYRGPISLRNALAQSINVPAVKMLYLSGIADSIKTARSMGITTLTNPDQYGLTLVLGGGEVTLLDMTSAYGGFATGGIRHPYQDILKVEDASGKVLEQYSDKPQTVLPKNTALMISSILSDNKAKEPLYGPNSPIYFYDRDVASKTGTTNDYRDAWIVGYTPSLVVGAWAGNNDNTPMEKKTSGLIIAPLWAEFMRSALKDAPPERFEKPAEPNNPETTKPAIDGLWQGNDSFFIDKISGKLATPDTPKETREEKVITDVHSILYWVNKNDPLGPKPARPEDDPQFLHWEIPVQKWWSENSYKYPITTASDKPVSTDDVHTPDKKPNISIIEPNSQNQYLPDQKINISISNNSFYPLKKLDIFINGYYLDTVKNPPFSYSFTPKDLSQINKTNEIKIVAQDSVFNTSETTGQFNVLVND
jgi:1A family penicillin-binding protein